MRPGQTIGGFPLSAILEKNMRWQDRARDGISLGAKVKRLRDENRMLRRALCAVVRKSGGMVIVPKDIVDGLRADDIVTFGMDDRLGGMVVSIKGAGLITAPAASWSQKGNHAP